MHSCLLSTILQPLWFPAQYDAAVNKNLRRSLKLTGNLTWLVYLPRWWRFSDNPLSHLFSRKFKTSGAKKPGYKSQLASKNVNRTIDQNQSEAQSDHLGLKLAENQTGPRSITLQAKLNREPAQPRMAEQLRLTFNTKGRQMRKQTFGTPILTQKCYHRTMYFFKKKHYLVFGNGQCSNIQGEKTTTSSKKPGGMRVYLFLLPYCEKLFCFLSVSTFQHCSADSGLAGYITVRLKAQSKINIYLFLFWSTGLN